MTPARRDTPAFTLTELLVVIGIVALMISIVLPLISQIRRSSLKRQMEIKAAAVQEPESATTAVPVQYGRTCRVAAEKKRESPRRDASTDSSCAARPSSSTDSTAFGVCAVVKQQLAYLRRGTNSGRAPHAYPRYDRR